MSPICKKCGKVFRSSNHLNNHKRFCKGKQQEIVDRTPASITAFISVSPVPFSPVNVQVGHSETTKKHEIWWKQNKLNKTTKPREDVSIFILLCFFYKIRTVTLTVEV